MTGSEAISPHLVPLVEFVLKTPSKRIPPSTLEVTRLVLQDTLGAVLAASIHQSEAWKAVVSLACSEGGEPRSTILGLNMKTSISMAGLVNGTAAYALDIEPVQPASVTHAASVVVPTALAVAEAEDLNGYDVMTAVTMGIEFADRIGRALGPRNVYARGFHPTSIAGGLAATITAARLLGANVSETQRALGLAATQTGGLMGWQADSSETVRPFNSGCAARNGIVAILLAGLGMGGDGGIEGYGGLFNAFTDHSDASALDRGLSHDSLAITHSQFKLFSCCAFLQAAVEATLLARTQIQEPRSIDIYVPESARPIVDGHPLRSHNAQYIVSVAALRGMIAPSHIFNDQRLTDPTVASLAKNATVHGSSEFERLFPESCGGSVLIHGNGNQRAYQRVDYPLGHSERPLGAQQINEKFDKLVSIDTASDNGAALRALIDDLAAGSAVREFTKAITNLSSDIVSASFKPQPQPTAVSKGDRI